MGVGEEEEEEEVQSFAGEEPEFGEGEEQEVEGEEADEAGEEAWQDGAGEAAPEASEEVIDEVDDGNDEQDYAGYAEEPKMEGDGVEGDEDLAEDDVPEERPPMDDVMPESAAYEDQLTAEPEGQAFASLSQEETVQVPARGNPLAKQLINNFYQSKRLEQQVLDVLTYNVTHNTGAWTGVRRAAAGRILNGADLRELIRLGLLDPQLVPSVRALGYYVQVPASDVARGRPKGPYTTAWGGSHHAPPEMVGKKAAQARPADEPAPEPAREASGALAGPPSDAPRPGAFPARGPLSRTTSGAPTKAQARVKIVSDASRRALALSMAADAFSSEGQKAREDRERERRLAELERLAEKEKIGTRFTGVRERRRTDDGDSGRVRRLASLTHARFLEETVGRGQGGALSRDMKDRNKSTKGAGNAHSSPKTPHTGTIRRGPTTGDKGVGKSPSDHSPLAGKTLNFGATSRQASVKDVAWDGRQGSRFPSLGRGAGQAGLSGRTKSDFHSLQRQMPPTQASNDQVMVMAGLIHSLRR